MRLGLPGALLAARGGGPTKRFVVALATIVLIQGGEARAQDLERQVSQVRDGQVAFRYPTNEAVWVCDHGVRIDDRYSLNRDGRRREEDCVEGEAEVILEVRNGEIRDLELRPPRADLGVETDLGSWSADDAAAFLIGLARRSSSRRVAEDAIVPAIIARGVVVWPDLIEIARDRSRPEDVREQAVFWVGQRAADAATDGRDDLLTDDDDDVEVRKAAVFALSQRPQHEAVPALMEVAETSRFVKVRHSAIFWLGQTGDSQALDFFERILTDTGVR